MNIDKFYKGPNENIRKKIKTIVIDKRRKGFSDEEIVQWLDYDSAFTASWIMADHARRNIISHEIKMFNESPIITIKEIKTKKREAEAQILQIARGFQQQTGFCVSQIDLGIAHSISESGSKLVSIRMIVELS